MCRWDAHRESDGMQSLMVVLTLQLENQLMNIK